MKIQTYLFYLIILAWFFVACKKEPQYSTWYVNGQQFTTNDVRKEEGKAVHELITNQYKNGFQLAFNLYNFPQQGTFQLNCSSQDPQYVCLNVLYNDTGYLPKPQNGAYLKASSLEKKASYSLDQAWFYNAYRPTQDSIMVYGTFNEP